MKHFNSGGHSAYQRCVLAQLRKYYPDAATFFPASTWEIMEKFWNPRLFNAPPRSSKEWKIEYNARTSTERCNKRVKVNYRLEDGRFRSSKMWYCRLFSIMMCQHLDAWVLPKARAYWYILDRNKKNGNIILKENYRETLEKIVRSQIAEYRKVQRAKIILYIAYGMMNSEIAAAIGGHSNTVANLVNKYLVAGLDYAIGTQKYLATKPARFEFVFTPKHGSWLDLIESFFGKMAKPMCKGCVLVSRKSL